MPGYRPSGEYAAQASHAQHAAATATETRAIFTAPCACRVRAVRATPHAASTGDNTNTTFLNLVNKGAAGAGTTEVGNKDLTTGVNLAAHDETSIPLNATFAAGVSMAEGDVLGLEYEKVGTGVAVGPLEIVTLWEPL
jgi:hypothetical protein